MNRLIGIVAILLLLAGISVLGQQEARSAGSKGCFVSDAAFWRVHPEFDVIRRFPVPGQKVDPSRPPSAWNGIVPEDIFLGVLKDVKGVTVYFYVRKCPDASVNLACNPDPAHCGEYMLGKPPSPKP